MNYFKTLFLLLSVGYHLTSCSQFPLQTYYYIEMEMNWTDAQYFCRENYTDLATFTSRDDIGRLKPITDYLWAWIGLSDDLQYWKFTMGNQSNSWRWSATGEPSESGYSNWATGEPQNSEAEEICGGMAPDGKWVDLECKANFYFVCYTVTNENDRTYVLITDTEPWDSAVEYCRAQYTDLAVIDSIEQNNEVSTANVDARIVWIGLYRVPWAWSDKSQSSFTNWDLGQPNNLAGQEFCVAENEQHEWDDRDCRAKYPFICHKVSRLGKMVRVKFQTVADISSDPAVSTQILQKLSAAIAGEGRTDVVLKWRIQPKKLVEDGVVESEETGEKQNGNGPPGQANKN